MFILWSLEVTKTFLLSCKMSPTLYLCSGLWIPILYLSIFNIVSFVLQHLKTPLNSDPVLPCSCMTISVTPPSRLISIISVAPMKPFIVRAPSLLPPISCKVTRTIQWISFSMGLWLKFLQFHMGSEFIAALWVSCEGTWKILAKSEYKTSPFSSLVGSSVEKQRACGSDRISSWQACVSVTYHFVIFYRLMYSSFSPLFPEIATVVTTT